MNQGLPQIISEAQEALAEEFAHIKPASKHITGQIDLRDWNDLNTLLAEKITKACEEMGRQVVVSDQFCEDEPEQNGAASAITEQERLISNFLKPV